MLFSRDFTNLELVFIAIFTVLYVLYLIRTILKARRMQSEYGNVFVKLVLRTAIFALLIVAILGPSYGKSKKEIKSIGKDIMICVDLSASMNVTDVKPSRLQRIKFELKGIVEAFSSDRVGLIMFSNEAFMQCPLTFDQNALNLFIDNMNTGLVPTAGTDFGPPLEMALDKIIDDKERKSKPKSKIIILISDGEDFGEDTGEAAKKIKESGIKLFTLGIGTDKGAKIRTRRGYKKDKNGKTIVSKLDPSSLKNLANITDGNYFEITDKRNDIDRLKNKINAIEGELQDTRKMDASANRYFYVLYLVLALVLADVWINLKAIRI